MPLTGLVAAARRRSEEMKQQTEQIRKEPQKIKQEVKRVLDFSSELENAVENKQLQWQECKHLKRAGEKNFCKRYMAYCAEEKCNPKHMNGEERELDFKRLLRGK
jgi:glutamine synthetase adenylyltransferase